MEGNLRFCEENVTLRKLIVIVNRNIVGNLYPSGREKCMIHCFHSKIEIYQNWIIAGLTGPLG